MQKKKKKNHINDNKARQKYTHITAATKLQRKHTSVNACRLNRDLKVYICEYTSIHHKSIDVKKKINENNIYELQTYLELSVFPSIIYYFIFLSLTVFLHTTKIVLAWLSRSLIHKQTHKKPNLTIHHSSIHHNSL